MAFSDCDEPSDPCLIKSKSMMSAIEVTSSFSSILLKSNNSYNLQILKLPLNTSFDELKPCFANTALFPEWLWIVLRNSLFFKKLNSNKFIFL
jgi:hypothetical protein